MIGLAVTREVIPVRVWCWPGNAAGSALIRQVKEVLLVLHTCIQWEFLPQELGFGSGMTYW